MKRSVVAATMMIVAGMILSVSAVRADTIIGVHTLDGSQTGIGHDPDKPAPTITSSGFYAQGGVGDYNSVRFTPDALGFTNLTVADIQTISYDHQQDGGGIDWQMKVYTESSTSTGSGWYGYRLNYDLSTANGDGSWSNFSDTNSDAERIKPYNTSANTYRASDPTGFASLLATIGNEKVMFFDISAGAQSGGYVYDTYLNNISIETTQGTATLVAVPLPNAAWGGLAMMGMLGGVVVRKRLRNADA